MAGGAPREAAPPVNRATIEQTIIRLAKARGPGKSLCPSEVARQLATDDWRVLMPTVLGVAAMLVERGRIRVTQGGRTVDIASVRGPIRLSIVETSRQGSLRP